MTKKTRIPTFSTIIFILLLIWGFTSQTLADGKFLRGEKWKKYTVNANEADFYVAPNGNDAWSGTLAEPNAQKTDGPFATLARAQKAVRQLKSQIFAPKKAPVEKRWIGSPHKFGSGKDILVLLREGYYSLENPLKFEAKDGGERCETDLPSGAFEYHKLKDYYVTYAARPGEKAVISGGRKLNSWQKSGDKWSTRVKLNEISKLVVNGKMQTLARTPNTGYFKPAEISKTPWEITFREGELAAWQNMKNNRVIMLLRWHTGKNSFAKIDATKRVARFKEPQRGVLVVPPRYYVENVPALLDAPGEWYFDTNSKELSFIPPGELANPNQANILTPRIANLIIVEGKSGQPVRNLRFYDLHFEATNPGASAISLQYAHNCELVDSKINSVGGLGVHVTKGCYQTRILNNHIVGAESGGIQVTGEPHPAKWTDCVRETLISYNYLADCGGRAIGAYNTLFTTISHNEITNNLGRTAISVGGWSNLEEAITGGFVVEYNHLHHVQKWADDSGAITTSGLTTNSVVRRNLIHDVKAGYFNDNVALWFDNMSSGWLAEENIYYNLEQAEMKLCAANLTDNDYQNNYLIEAPAHPPDGIIEDEPKFDFKSMQIKDRLDENRAQFQTGEFIYVTALVENMGATGFLPVDFYVDGKVLETKLFPVIQNNRREITFKVRFHAPGTHRVAIGTLPFQQLEVGGKELAIFYDDLTLSDSYLPAGNKVTVTASVKNISNIPQKNTANLLLNSRIVLSKSIELAAGEIQKIHFELEPPPGVCQLQLEHIPPKNLQVYAHQKIDISQAEFQEYCSGTANPCRVKIDAANNRFRIEAGGTDFYHAEDSYGAVYLKQVVRGNFVATVKVKRFGAKTHEWFRAGIFARNDISKSFDAEKGSPGSVLMFVTPGRAGIQWDEFNDGCMHKASSQNHSQTEPYPMWIKLVRHGNSFSGYVSYDGVHWAVSRHTTPVPGLAEIIDLGLVAGSCDQIPYWVEFEDFQIETEQFDGRGN